MNSETNRLQTFCNWPSSAPVDPPRIAKAGFYYTGVGLEVQCFSCHGKITFWNYDDQVMWRHRHLKPSCPFVLNPTNSGNIPIVDVFEYSNTDEPAQLHNSMEESINNDDSGPRDYGLTEEDEMYRNDALRLLSFINWNNQLVTRESLVNAGFYFTEGKIRCAWCGGEINVNRSFGFFRTPLEMHRMYFPRCDHAATLEANERAYLSNLDTQLILPSATSTSPPSVTSSPPSETSPPTPTPPIRSPETNENNTLSAGAAHNSRILNAGNTWRALGVVGSGARHPNQASLTTRLATFDRWPADKTQSPRAMAEAGFFHTGTDDQVRCFYCDGGLGRWEAGDAPWSEHARWFPTCGYVLLVKGQDYVEECRERSTEQRTVPAPSNVGGNRRNQGLNVPITEAQIDECMESGVALGALGAGLDAARVRRALARRLRAAGTPFPSSEALIDAVLDEQLGEEAWSVNTQSQRFAQDILHETLRELGVPHQIGIHDSTSESDRTRTPSPIPPVLINRVPRVILNRIQPTNQTQPADQTQPASQTQPVDQTQLTNQNQTASQSANVDQSAVRQNRESESDRESSSETRHVSLEEENRQLKEARLCKVCMDSEVSVVFLPCGHLVSCARCGAALAACPLCRSAVRALVRAYLA